MSDASNKPFDLIVVGAGAAGQLAAIAAAEQGRRVLVQEQMPQPGLKILASGGGRCNLTHLAEHSVIEAAFGRQGRFMEPALRIMGPEALRQFFDRLGLKTKVIDGSRVFPATERSRDVQTVLSRRMEQLGVQLHTGQPVSRLWIEEHQLRGAELTNGKRIEARRVILACGGRSYSALGGTGRGYTLARQAGHKIIEPTPALVPLVTQESWPARVAGVALTHARIWIALPKQSKTGITGDVLFTHRGVSGPAVLDLSSNVAQLLQRERSVPVRIELLDGMDTIRWNTQLDTWRKNHGSRQILPLLREKLPASLGQVLCELAGLPEQTPAAQLSAAAREKLARLLGALELTVIATEGFEQAFVTRGGVELKQVCPDTLESRLLPGLYFAGELLDLDGPTGGFNLQWAFASGWLAGRSAAD